MRMRSIALAVVAALAGAYPTPKILKGKPGTYAMSENGMSQKKRRKRARWPK